MQGAEILARRLDPGERDESFIETIAAVLAEPDVTHGLLEAELLGELGEAARPSDELLALQPSTSADYLNTWAQGVLKAAAMFAESRFPAHVEAREDRHVALVKHIQHADPDDLASATAGPEVRLRWLVWDDLRSFIGRVTHLDQNGRVKYVVPTARPRTLEAIAIVTHIPTTTATQHYDNYRRKQRQRQ